MDFDERLEYLSDVSFYIEELTAKLKDLGSDRYANYIDIMSDLQKEVSFDEALTEQRTTEMYRRNEEALIKEYWQSR